MEKHTSAISTSEIARISIVAALYVVVTLLIAPFGFGPIQFRLSESLNFLAFYHKRYVWAVTLGCIIANFMSPTWMLDVPLGSLATLISLLLSRKLAQNIQEEWKKYLVMMIIFSISMLVVAFQLYILEGLPFIETFVTSAISEFLTMTVGAVIISQLNRVLHFETL